VDLARRYGRYGYRRITALLRRSGWAVNKKRVERIWRREGLKVPHKLPKRGRLVAKAVQDWIAQIGAKTAYIEKASPWENGYCESIPARRGWTPRMPMTRFRL
jgi:HTH-like domain